MSVKNVDCLSWWQAMCKNTQLKYLAVALTSSAATERSFSTYSFIHTKKRNRLTAQRAGKLMFVAHNNKLLLQKQKVDMEHDIQQHEIPPEPAELVEVDIHPS